MHPTVKIVAEFPHEVNSRGMGVPSHQVKEFSPRLSFGCSISSPAHLALALMSQGDHLHLVQNRWKHMAIYYAMSRGGRGSVRPLPFFRDPLVRFSLTNQDLADLADGLRKLAQCLFASGASTLYPCVSGYPRLTCEEDLDNLPAVLPAARANLMSIHLFGSCPMGEDRKSCVTDSYGMVHGTQGLGIADASLLCGPPGVNPQGSIMAIVRRNMHRFVEAASR